MPRSMRISPSSVDEVLRIEPEDGRLTYQAAPVNKLIVSFAQRLPISDESANEKRYLWVVSNDDAPHALEFCAWATTLSAKKLKHSNLTGGGEAYIGGELWFVDDRTVILNFCSGRYGATSRADLPIMEATICALLKDGYRVATTGPDFENGYPSSKLLTSDPIYMEPVDA